MLDDPEHTEEKVRERLRGIGSICLIEDISTVGSSASAVAALMRDVNPNMDIHSLSILQRSDIDPAYTEGQGAVDFHTLLRRDVPLTRREFCKTFPEIIPRELRPGDY